MHIGKTETRRTCCVRERRGHVGLYQEQMTDTGQPAARWPSVLWVVHHGQSAGNVARDVADEAGEACIVLKHRDVDVPLSELGRQQAASLGRWFASSHEDGRPEVMLASPYRRASETARIFSRPRRLRCGRENLQRREAPGERVWHTRRTDAPGHCRVPA